MSLSADITASRNTLSDANLTLRVSEIFYSLQGESRTIGIPTVFVRLTGCPLRCHYCDTEYAFTGGTTLMLNGILDQVAHYRTRYVTVTGGEPLAQANCWPLLNRLCEADYKVSLETSGAIGLDGIDERVHIVMDIKTPASGEADKNRWENLAHLKPDDEIKFVICDRDDYEWMKLLAQTHDLFDRFAVVLSPSFGEVEIQSLAEWVLEDQLPARVQMQLHKLIWGEEQGR